MLSSRPTEHSAVVVIIGAILYTTELMAASVVYIGTIFGGRGGEARVENDGLRRQREEKMSLFVDCA